MIVAENKVRIEGILAEVNMREGEFKKKDSGVMMPYLAGDIQVRLTQDINGVPVDMVIPVNFFVTKYKNDGNENPAYKGIEELRSYTSLAAAETPDQADGIRINSGSLAENIFYTKRGALVTTPVVNANFFYKVKQSDLKPEASFMATMCIGNITEELDKEGTPTGALKLQGIIPKFGDKVDVLEFSVRSAEAIEHISAHWSLDDTVKIAGKLNFSTTTTYSEEAMGFGDAIVSGKTEFINDLIITSGSAGGLDGDLAYDKNDITKALLERKARIQNLRKPDEGPATARKSFSSLGF